MNYSVVENLIRISVYDSEDEICQLYATGFLDDAQFDFVNKRQEMYKTNPTAKDLDLELLTMARSGKYN